MKTPASYKLLMFGTLVLGVMIFAGGSTYAFVPSKLDLSERQITALSQARKFREQGDYDQAKIIIDEADIDIRALRNAQHEHRKLIKEAIANNDYEAFVHLTADKPFASLVDEYFFAQMVAAHELRLEGNYEAARAILDKLGTQSSDMPNNSDSIDAARALLEDTGIQVFQDFDTSATTTKATNRP